MTPAINLMPWREKLYKTKLCNFLWFLTVATLITIFIGIFFHIRLQQQLAKLSFNDKVMTYQSKKLNTTIKHINDIIVKKQQWQSTIHTLNLLQQKSQLPLTIINILINVMPSNAYLDSVRYDNKTLALSGYANDSTTLSMIVNRLKDFPSFSHVILTEVTMNQNELLNHRFNMTLQVSLTR